nr:MAG TPA: hypothetical protein [Caudoviricetes sp.]
MRTQTKVRYEEVFLTPKGRDILDVFGTQFKGEGKDEYVFLFAHVDSDNFNREVVEKEISIPEGTGKLFWKYMGTYDHTQQHVEYGYGNDAILIRQGHPGIV